MSLLIISLLLAAAPQLPLSYATTDDALAVFANPAGLGVGPGFDCYYMYDFAPGSFGDNNSFAASFGPLGAFWEPGRRYGFAIGGGSGAVLGGLRVTRDSLTRWSAGTMGRPARFVSAGLVWDDFAHDFGSVGLGVAVRPLGTRLTLSADVRTTRLGQPDIALTDPVFGVEAEPFDGIVLAGRVKPADWSFSAGLTVGLGRFSVGGVGSYVAGHTRAGTVVRVGSERRSVVPKPRRFLEIRLAGGIEDRKPGFSLMGSRPKRTTWQLLDLVRRAREDASIQGLLIRLDGFRASLAQLQEFRAELVEFRAAGKKVYVYAPSPSMVDYYLASVADRIIGHPMGDVNIPGVAMHPMFLKGTFEKLGIEFDYQRSGTHKSAVETFTEDSLSPANREQLEAYLDALFEQFIEDVSRSRNMTREELRELVDHGYFMAHEAQAHGLIDTFCYHDQLDDLLKDEVKGYRAVAEKEYARGHGYEYEWRGPPAIAIVYATGSIASGESRTDFLTGTVTMGAKTMVRAIRAAREDDRVKAIVLRVDSPGGSGFASDLIWRELELAREEKPVVVSMGGVAASGGYYIACGANRIFADPATLTGSIGVFGFKIVTEGLYNKLGARRQVLKRGEHADMYSDARPFTTEEDSLLQDQIRWFYEQFVGKVAQGRGMSFEAVDSVAGGRIWAGSDAHRIGLVDSLGGLFAAVEWAKSEAKLKECDFVFYPKPKSGVGAMLGRFIGTQIQGALGR